MIFMVDFDTRIFSEDDGKIIGAEVTVYSDSGNKLGSISVADAETLQEMQAQLAVIDETYFTEDRLATILLNQSESTPINATKLGGLASSSFAKVSQLSNYAPVNHNHSVSQITNLYDYQIYASSYNVNIDSSVTITVKVTNRATGRPVVGVTVPVLKNNQTWQSGTTGVNGTFSLSYTCDSWGLTTFSANTAQTQINIKGWKQINTGIFDFSVNGHLARLIFKINDESTPVKPTFEEFGGYVIPQQYRPKSQITNVAYSGNNIILAVMPDGKITRRSMYSYTIQCGIWGTLFWEY